MGRRRRTRGRKEVGWNERRRKMEEREIRKSGEKRRRIYIAGKEELEEQDR